MNTTISVQNLKCGGCARTITDAISGIEGISSAEVKVETSEVHFEYTDEQQLQKVREKLKSLGYPSVEDPNSLIDKTKSFVSCATGKLKK